MNRFFDCPASGRSDDVCTPSCSGEQRDLRVDERVVGVEEEVTADLAARLQLDAEVPGVVGVLERRDRVRRRDDDALDRLVEVLVEDARREDAAAAA